MIKNNTQKEKSWNTKILSITLKIRSNYPELIKYLDEMPNTFQDKTSPVNEAEELKLYYESLTALVNNYVMEKAKETVTHDTVNSNEYKKSMCVNNHVLSYCEYGPPTAPVILFIHGFPLNQTMWEQQVASLKNTHRIVSYDIRGHGNSEMGAEKFTMDLFVADFFAFINALHLEKVIVCGISMGGYICLKALSKYPERFEALILCGTQCVADTPEIMKNRYKAIDVINNKGIEQFAADMLKNLFAKESYFTKVSMINEVLQMIITTNKTAIINTLVALAEREQTCQHLNSFKVPVLLLVGNEDRLTPPDASKFMHSKISESKMIVIDKSGHLCNIENPKQFNIEINKFLVSLASKK